MENMSCFGLELENSMPSVSPFSWQPKWLFHSGWLSVYFLPEATAKKSENPTPGCLCQRNECVIDRTAVTSSCNKPAVHWAPTNCCHWFSFFHTDNWKQLGCLYYIPINNDKEKALIPVNMSWSSLHTSGLGWGRICLSVEVQKKKKQNKQNKKSTNSEKPSQT